MNLMPILLAGAGVRLVQCCAILFQGYIGLSDIPSGTLLVNFAGSTILSMITSGQIHCHMLQMPGYWGFTTFFYIQL